MATPPKSPRVRLSLPQSARAHNDLYGRMALEGAKAKNAGQKERAQKLFAAAEPIYQTLLNRPFDTVTPAEPPKATQSYMRRKPKK